MNKEGVMAFDVGGTTVDAGFVSDEGELIGAPQQIESPSSKTPAEIIQTFIDLGNNVTQSHEINGYKPTVVSIAIPGPFEYDTGISRMSQKFELLNGVNVKIPLEEAFSLPVTFLNDADAFALGVSWKEYPQEQKLLVITLGTGTGSGFIVNGQLSHEGKGIPHMGEIYDVPVRDLGFEEFLLSEEFTHGFSNENGEKLTLDLVSKLAHEGNSSAVNHFEEFGKRLGHALSIVVSEFEPTRVVFGGGISNAFGLFGDRAEKVYQKETSTVVPFSKTSLKYAALFGAARHALSA